MNERNDPVAALLRLSKDLPEPDPMAVERAHREAHIAWREGLRRHARRRATLALAAAASLVLAMVAGASLWPRAAMINAPLADLEQIVGDVEVDARDWNDSGERMVALGPGSVLETAYKGRAAFRLKNGSRVRLDSSTRVRLDGRARLELEAGALYFDSSQSREADQAVEITTPIATLVNRGTSYEARMKGDDLFVAVRAGKVLVEPRRGASAVVERGQVMRLRANGTRQFEELSPADPRFEWTHPLVEPFDIDGRTIGEFLDWVERESGLEVRLGAGVETSILDQRLRGDVVWTSPESSIAPTLELVGSRVRFENGLVVVER